MYWREEPPPEMPLNDYIVHYKQTGDKQYLDYFFHCYEHALNNRTFRFCDHYKQLRYFEDVKQTIVQALLELLPHYDQSTGVDFVVFARPYVADAAHNFLRQNCGAFVVPVNRYKTLRKVMAIYFADPYAYESERIQAIAEQTGLSDEKINNYVIMGKVYRFSESIEVMRANENESGRPGIFHQPIPILFTSPDVLIPDFMLYEAMVDAIEALGHKDRRILLDYLGIWCLYCRRVGEPIPKEDIAAMFQIKKVQSVDNNFDRIVEKLREVLEGQGWIE